MKFYVGNLVLTRRVSRFVETPHCIFCLVEATLYPLSHTQNI